MSVEAQIAMYASVMPQCLDHIVLEHCLEFKENPLLWLLTQVNKVEQIMTQKIETEADKNNDMVQRLTKFMKYLPMARSILNDPEFREQIEAKPEGYEKILNEYYGLAIQTLCMFSNL